MPKKPNVKKAASAQYQNIKALAEASSGAEGMVYLAVEKAMGNRYFLCRDEEGNPIMAEPRKLFTKGSMRVEKGAIVVAQEPVLPGWKQLQLREQRVAYMAECKKARQSGGNAPAPPLGLPHEIVGVIAERSEAKRLIRTRAMPQSILDQALAAEGGPAVGGAEAKPLLADDLEFMTTEEAAREAKQQMLAAMSPEERADYATRTQMEKKLQMAGGGGGAFQSSGLDLEEVSEFRAKDDGHHASRGMKQARAAADARASIQQRLAALLSGSKKAAADVAVGDVLLEEEELPMAGGAAPTRFKQLRAKKTEEQKAAERAAAAAATRRTVELDDMVAGLMGFSEANVASAEAARQAEVARLQAELEAMGAVEDWEEAADAADAWNGRLANGLGRIRTPPDSDEDLPSTAGREQEVCLEDL